MMYWFGFATGVSAAFFVFAAFTWRITKERSESAKAMDGYWKTSMENQRHQIMVLDSIDNAIRSKL